jgi:type I restriction enzyme S subunit
MLAPKKIEHFTVDSRWLKGSKGLRLDAGFYNPRLAQALEALHKSGLKLAKLGDVTKSIFIPPRFARTYVEKEHGVPFLQGSHIVHFQPADLKYVSPAVHKKLAKWIIHKNWILVTRSGTVGRVTITPESWDGWAASEHILRIIPKDECPAGYIYALLNSPIGQAQLTAQIYGAVVDELTEEQTKSVLIPVASNPRQREQINAISELSMKAVKKWQEAASLASQAVLAINDLVPPLAAAEPEIKVPGVSEFEKFQNFTQMLLAVPKSEVQGGDTAKKAKAK